MNKKLLNILVCPFDKVTSLDLFEFEMKTTSLPGVEDNKIVASDNESSLNKKNEATAPATQQTNTKLYSEDNSEGIVVEGILFCKTCGRFYPITEEIPIILPDELRDKKKDIDFLKKWSKSIGPDLLKTLKPWTV